MTCQDVRPLLLDFRRGRLGREHEREVDAHMRSCAACAHENAADQLLSDALEHRLPQHAAPFAVKRRLGAQWPAEPHQTVSWWNRWKRSVVPALAVATALLIAVPVYYHRGGSPDGSGSGGMVAEAVSDHLRILSSQHPLDIESGGMHQVKPWFEGRLDFAPVVHFLGDEDFPLRGGAVGYYLERKAAIFAFSRRLHQVSLFVFRAGGLPWPTRGLQPIGAARALVTASRGFNVVLWREGELGYALVSDLDTPELAQLATKVAGGA
jgi:anti-sigma factor RsiW